MSPRTEIVRQQLMAIPELALEVEATRDHPNPDGRPERHNAVPGSRPPTDLAMLHAVMPDGDADYVGRGLRGELAMCVRLVIEEMADVLPTSDIPTYPSDTWSGICAWLDATHCWWSETQWAADIVADVARVHAQLSELCRVQREPTYRCPKCRDVMRLQAGGQWLRCDSGHEESADLERRHRRRPMAPVSSLAEEFGVDPQQIYDWKRRGRLSGTRRQAGELWCWPWDILLLANPVIAEAIATREALTP